MMRTWMKLLVVTAMLALAVSEKSHVCSFDNPDVTQATALSTIRDEIAQCFNNVVDVPLNVSLKDAKTLEDYRNVFKPFCSRREEVTACMTEVRASLSSCKNKTFSVPKMAVLDIIEHVLISGCEQEGERLAGAMYGLSKLKEDRERFSRVNNCFTKAIAVLELAEKPTIDVTSKLYLYYKEMPSMRRCLENIEDESFKDHLLPMFDTGISHFKCYDPEGDRLIPCNDMDVSKVTVTDVCTLKLDPDELTYDQLEEETIQCFQLVFRHDLMDERYDSLEWLKNEYKVLCDHFKYTPTCPMKMAGIAERCLPAAEGRQFGFFMDYVGTAVERACEHDGVGMALIMHEIYRLAAQHGHAVRECFKQAMKAREARETLGDSKNMRWYRDMTTYKECVVQRLQGNPVMAQAMESMSDDVLRQAKCVSPEDGSQVLCETIFNH